MSAEDLIPMNKRTKEEQKRIARLGGKASGKARRWKADIKACILDKLGEDATMEALVTSMLAEAMNGNVAAANFIRDTAGQKPIEQSKVEAKEEVVYRWKGRND